MTCRARAARPVRGDVTIESLVDDLHEVVEHAGGTARVHLAGHSLGTIICQHYAARYHGSRGEPCPARRLSRAARARPQGFA